MLGPTIPDSTRLNNPSYSFAKLQNPKRLPIISKEHVQELVGKDTPGVGAYQEEILVKTNGGQPFSKSIRFQPNDKLLEHPKVPHGYGNVNFTPKCSLKIGRENRFGVENPIHGAKVSPGPANY